MKSKSLVIVFKLLCLSLLLSSKSWGSDVVHLERVFQRNQLKNFAALYMREDVSENAYANVSYTKDQFSIHYNIQGEIHTFFSFPLNIIGENWQVHSGSDELSESSKEYRVDILPNGIIVTERFLVDEDLYVFDRKEFVAGNNGQIRLVRLRKAYRKTKPQHGNWADDSSEEAQLFFINSGWTFHKFQRIAPTMEEYQRFVAQFSLPKAEEDQTSVQKSEANVLSMHEWRQKLSCRQALSSDTDTTEGGE